MSPIASSSEAQTIAVGSVPSASSATAVRLPSSTLRSAGTGSRAVSPADVIASR